MGMTELDRGNLGDRARRGPGVAIGLAAGLILLVLAIVMLTVRPWEAQGNFGNPSGMDGPSPQQQSGDNGGGSSRR
jgi:hypothetical protein